MNEEPRIDANTTVPPELPEDWPTWALALYPNGTLAKFRSAQAARLCSPPGARIWGTARLWEENSKTEEFVSYLLPHQDRLQEEQHRWHHADWKLKVMWPLLLQVATDPGLGRSSTGPEEGEGEMAKAKKTKEAKETNGTGKRGRKSSLDTGKKIVLKKEGPLAREGTTSGERLKVLRSGMLVSTALEKGVTAADLLWHSKKGNLALE